ncbi:hypothetical protein [Nitrosopumilus sp.]|uniref:hypothetical protein n=1 Tax=Nitrosopumilus sp. TaxID=2024843 RepID=UPI0034A093FB
MTMNNKKATIVLASSVLIVLAFVPMQLNAFGVDENQASGSLTIIEQTKIPKSIKSFEVKNFEPENIRNDISKNHLSINYKGDQYDLRLFEDRSILDENFKAYEMVDGSETVVSIDHIKIYTGYVSGDSDSRVSLVVSDDNVSGFIKTADTEIAIEPLSFMDKTLQGDKQIMYDLSDLTSNLDFGDDVRHMPDMKAESKTVDWIEDGIIPLASADPGHQAGLIVVADTDYITLHGGSCTTQILTIVGGMNSIYYDTEATMNLLSVDCAGNTYLDSSSIGGNLTDLEEEWDGLGTTRDMVLAFLGDDKDYGGLGEAWDIPGIDDPTNNGYAVMQMVDDTYVTDGYDARYIYR